MKQKIKGLIIAIAAIVLMGCPNPVIDVIKSTNADLATLTVDSGTLSPVFAAATTVYSVTVANTVTSLIVSGTKADANTSVSAAVTLSELVVGVAQTATITVTAQSGAIKSYTVTATRAAAEVAVEILPIIDFSSGARSIVSRSLDISAVPNWGYYLYAPILTGWKANANSVKINDTYIEGFLGSEVSITVSKNITKGTIVYTGTIAGGNGNFIASYDPSKKTFSYEQNTFLSLPVYDSYGFVRCEFKDVLLDQNRYFHTSFISYFLDWSAGTTTAALAGGQQEFYYGLDSSGKEVVGWAWSAPMKITSAFALDHAPGMDDLPVFDAKIAEGYATWPGEDSGTFIYGFHDTTGFHVFTIGEKITHADLQAIIPWTLMF